MKEKDRLDVGFGPNVCPGVGTVEKLLDIWVFLGDLDEEGHSGAWLDADGSICEGRGSMYTLVGKVL